MSQWKQWRVQLWLGEYLIEEHFAPTALAEQYANVIRLRIRGLPGRRLHCEPVTENGPTQHHIRTTLASDSRMVWRDRHHTSRAE